MRDGFIEIGALARLESVRRHPLIAAQLPMLAAALAWVANPAIRLRGTLVGNLVQFAAGAEAVAVAMLSAARLVTPDGRTRALGAQPDASFVTHVRLDPSPVATRAGFIEMQRRSGHLGTVGCGVAALPNGAYQVVFSGLLEAPLPAPVVAAELARGGHDRSRIATALAHDLAGRTPRSDLHADAAYRLAVAPVLVGRVVAQLEAAT